MSRKITKSELTIPLLCDEARRFAKMESTYAEPTLFGVTDGKAVGTYLEHKFQIYLEKNTLMKAEAPQRESISPNLG